MHICKGKVKEADNYNLGQLVKWRDTAIEDLKSLNFENTRDLIEFARMGEKVAAIGATLHNIGTATGARILIIGILEGYYDKEELDVD